MKADRRHQLQENELAKDMARMGLFLRKHLSKIIMAIAAVALIVMLVIFIFHRRAEGRQQEWATLRALTQNPQGMPDQTRQDLAKLAEETSQKELAAAANLQIGRLAYAEMIQILYKEPAKAADLGEEAARAYQRTLDRQPKGAEVLAGAHLGLGLLAETRADVAARAGDMAGARSQLEQARQQYDQVIALEAQGATPQAQQARDQRDQLGQREQPLVFVAHMPRPATQPAPATASAPATEPATMTATEPSGAAVPAGPDTSAPSAVATPPATGAEAAPSRPATGPSSVPATQAAQP